MLRTMKQPFSHPIFGGTEYRGQRTVFGPQFGAALKDAYAMAHPENVVTTIFIDSPTLPVSRVIIDDNDTD